MSSLLGESLDISGVRRGEVIHGGGMNQGRRDEQSRAETTCEGGRSGQF